MGGDSTSDCYASACSAGSAFAGAVKVHQSRISPGSRMESELGSVVSRDAFNCFSYTDRAITQHFTNQSNSMTSRRYIIYCTKRWPNRAGSAMPGARTFLRESEGSVATCRCVGVVLWGHVGVGGGNKHVWRCGWGGGSECGWRDGGYSGGEGGSMHVPVRSQLWRLRLRAAVLSCNLVYSIHQRKRRQFSDD
jgi:hypothetical protein